MDSRYDFPSVSMNIILQAGDAREKAEQAFEAAGQNDFEKARNLIDQANQCIREGHRYQTETMQSLAQAEFSGEDQPALPMLFIHAQDTIMTVMSEVSLIAKSIQMYENLEKQIEQLKEEKNTCRK